MLALVAAVCIAPHVASAALSRAVPGTVRGVSPSGTTINLFDYWTEDRTTPDNIDPDKVRELGINAGHTLKFKAKNSEDSDPDINKWTGDENPRSDMVEKTLGSGGYPTLTDGENKESLGYLFNPLVTNAGKQAFTNVTGLLQVDGNGYYYYDCTQNFAEFNEKENTGNFTLYDASAVTSGGNAGEKGQFFPFNNGNQVFENGTAETIASNDPALNHYFGLTMSTNFLQEDGGKNNGNPVTYEFSGDDDVWVFIDGVLVGDLGGIHNAASLKIDFSTGDIEINGVKDGTLRSKFEEASKPGDESSWSGYTFADDTYHTLDFFYLERGNVDSNMKLKFNLVSIPETNIKKVDQEKNPIPGVTFNVYNDVDGDGHVDDGEAMICTTAPTDADGNVVLLDNESGRPITLDDLNDSGVTNIVLKETQAPEGYRYDGEISLRLHDAGDGHVLLLSNNQWQTGVYSMAKVKSAAAESIEYTDATGAQQVRDTGSLKDSGMMFVVLEQKGTNGKWYPVSGDPLNGWEVSEADSISAVIQAAKATNAVFAIASSGSFEADVANIPGDVLTYEFFTGTENAKYRGAYFYSTASNWNEMDESNTFPVTNSDEFERQFSATVYVPNTINRIIAQKVDDAGNPVNGAVMGLYEANQVHLQDGVPVLNDGVHPSDEKTTENLRKAEGDSIDLEGACIFTNLDSGTYYIGEVDPPSNSYIKNNVLSKVIVDETGVYADAGAKGDGLTVTRGVGRIVRSMIQFAPDDDVDTTLHNIVATPQSGAKNDETNEWAWEPVEDAKPIHLEYKDDEDAVLDYTVVEVEDGSSEQRYMVDEGIPGLSIKQDWENYTGKQGTHRERLNDAELNALFTGVTIVTIQNDRQADLKITKNVEGENAPAGMAFDFTIALSGEKARPENDLLAVEIEGVGKNNSLTLQDDGSLKGNFSLKSGQALTATLPVGVEYTVTEQSYTLFDTTVAIDSGEASASLTATGMIGADGSTVAFTNTYAPETEVPGEAGLTVTKELHGGKALSGAKDDPSYFEFTITPSEGTDTSAQDAAKKANIPVDGKTFGTTAAQSDANGVATCEMHPFEDDLTFGANDAGKTFAYTVKENVPAEGNRVPGYEYDEKSHTVVFTVSEAGADGVGVTVTVDGQPGSDVTFVNRYIGTSGVPAGFSLSKKFTGTAWTNAYAFDFVLKPTGGTLGGGTPVDAGDVPMPNANEGAGVTIDEEGNAHKAVGGPTGGSKDTATFDFGAINYNEVGIYTYEVTETKGNTPDVTYDAHTAVVTVTVTEGQDGKLTASAVVLNGEFVNTYDGGTVIPPDPTDPEASDSSKPDVDIDKKLDGRDLAAGEFNFVIETAEDYGSKVSPKSLTATNAADGSVNFNGGFVFTKEGNYEFIIHEVMPADDDLDTEGIQHDGVTYDQAAYTAKANVSAVNGKLQVTWIVTDATGNKVDSIVFTNGYAEPDEPEVPDTPDTPDTPDVPDTPDTPDTPGEPDKPEGDNGSGDNGNGIPQTGDSTLLVAGTVLAVGAVAAGAGVALRKKRGE